MTKHTFELFADYHQLYLQDEEADGDLSNAWTPEAADRMLAIAPGTIGVGTARNMDVAVEIEVVDREPELDLVGWDRVNECSIDVPSGRIVVCGCTESFEAAARIEVTPGTYRVRVLYGMLDALSDDHLDGDDHYTLILWPGAPCGVTVLKDRRG